MNWLDLAIVVVIAWFTFAGLSAGLLREAVGLLAAALGVALAGQFYMRLGDDIKIAYDNLTVDRLAGFLSIFAACVLAGQLLGGLLKPTASVMAFGPADQVGGLFLGLAKGAIVVESLLIAFAVFPAADWMTEAIHSSLLSPVFLSGGPWLLHLLPAAFQVAKNFP